MDDVRRHQHAARVVAAEALGVHHRHVDCLRVHLHVLRRDAQVVVMDVFRRPVDGRDAGNPAIAPCAEGQRRLVARSWRQGVPQIRLDRRNRPFVDAEGLGHFVQDVRFGHPILRRARAVGVNVGALPDALFADDGAAQRERLGDRDVVADARAGNGLLEAVGVHEHAGDRAVDVAAHLQCKLVVRQHQIDRCFRQREAAVLAEGPAGAAVVHRVAAVDGHERVVFRQRPHGAVRLHDLRHDGRLGAADDGDAAAPGANVVHGELQVVEEGRAGADRAARAPQAADDVGVDEVGRHFAKPQRRLLRRGTPAHHGRLHHAAGAVAVQLPHRAAGIAGELIWPHMALERFPGQADGLHGVGCGVDGQLQAARMAARGVELSRLEAARRLASRRDLGDAAVRNQHVRAFGGDFHAAVFAPACAPAVRRCRRRIPFAQRKRELLARSRAQPGAALPEDGMRVEAVDAAHQGVVADVGANGGVGRVAFHVHQRGQAGVGLVRRGLLQRVDHRPPIGVVERDPSRRIDAAEADDHRQRLPHVPSLVCAVGAGLAFRKLETYARSKAMAVASPPPMHSDATPRLVPRAFSRWAKVTIKRLPVEPMGWPWAQAPP